MHASSASTHNPGRTRTALITVVLVGLTAGLLAGLLAGCQAQAPAAAASRTPVRAMRVDSGPAAPPIATEGVVANKDEARLAFKVGGIVAAIDAQAGEVVHRGQRLAWLEPPEVDARLEQARALAEKAQRDLARGERLHAEEVISLEQLQDLRTQARLSLAQLRSSEYDRSYADIRAPADGVVLRKLVEAHELVAPGQPVLALGSSARGVIVRAALADREIVGLRLGDRARVRVDSFPGQVLEGELSLIARAADASGMFPVEVRLAAPPQGLASGMVARLGLEPGAGGTLPYVSPAAILEGVGQRASVFVLEGERARRRLIDIAFITDQGVAVRAGLKPGERVVSEGALYLTDGDAVEVVPAAARAARNPPAITG